MKLLPLPPGLSGDRCQLILTLDAPKVRGLTAKQREVLLRALARMLLEARTVPVREDDDADV